MINVLVAEDSLVVRNILVQMLQSDPEVRVVGEARDGVEAVNKTAQLRPDVITMDVRMPRMGGLEATRQIMQETPTPIVIISASVHDESLNIAFNAVKAGAVMVMEKPHGLSHAAYEAVREKLVTSVKLMSEVKVVRRWAKERVKPYEPLPVKPAKKTKTEVVAIAASTGGPGVLHTILTQLPADFPAPLLLVQHITAGFTAGFVSWLNQSSNIEVVMATKGAEIRAGRVYVAPDDYHLMVMKDNRRYQIFLSKSRPSKGLRPSADPLFFSIAEVYRDRALGVILTGMGDDGTKGLRELKQAGGRCIAQDKTSSVVFGMPKEAIEAGVVDKIVPADKIAETIVNML